MATVVGREWSVILATIHKVPAIQHILWTSSRRDPRAHNRPPPRHGSGYATTASGANYAGVRSESQEPPAHSWPDAPQGQTHPTPYQIFDMNHDAKYTKAGYYKLVKLYHPDSQIQSSASSSARGHQELLSHSAKVDRYRLIVAAHEILSDPVKRSAYDRYGAGWNGKAEVSGFEDMWSQSSSSHFHHHNPAAGPFSQSWRGPLDPVWQNATWEDWERYYNLKANHQQNKRAAPVYMKNSSFVALLVAVAMMGCCWNVLRAQDNGTYVVEARDLVHHRSSRNLRQVKHEVQALTNRQDRIDFFLRQREAAAVTGSVSDHQPATTTTTSTTSNTTTTTTTT